MPLLQGRYFEVTDNIDNPGTILVNQQFADTFFADENPIDKRLSLDEGKTWLTIRGVVANTREMAIDIAPTPTFYTTFNEYTRWSWIKMLIRTQVPLNDVRESIVDTIQDLNAEQAIAQMTEMNNLKTEALSSENLVGQLVALFALLAFAIALTGVIGIVAYNVSQRRKEIGIRVALGANPKRIRWLFAVQGLSLCAIGIAIGAAIMAFTSPVLASALFETDALNLPMYFATGGAIVCFATLAILIPVQQATAIQPNLALREQ